MFALGVLATLAASPLFAQSTPAPPVWNDGGSVYLAKSAATPAVNSAEREADTQPPAAATGTESHQAELVATDTGDENRRLAPPSRPDVYAQASSGEPRGASHDRKLFEFGLPTQSIYTVLSALAIVIGAFLMFAWALRRGTKKSHAVLPADVASVLGRVPLAARQFAELLRVGNKLVLVSLTPNGAETLTEVTDPVEVDRLLGLCQQYDRHSTTTAFEQVFQQLSSEPGRAGFLGDDSLPTSFSPIAGAYRAHRGGPTRA